MIVYDVECSNSHRFEGWFADAAAFEKQRDLSMIECPYCSDTRVARVLSVPRIGGSVASDIAPDTVAKLAELQKAMLQDSKWVGDNFATKVRAMEDGTEPKATVHGSTTLGEAKALHEEGIAVVPLPFPVVPPEQCN